MTLSSREIGKEVFSALEQNLHPETGSQITPRTNSTRQEWGINPKTGEKELQTVDNHRPGMDLPFIVPKTLSEVMAENPGQFAEAIEKICVAAKDRAMALAESLVKTRVRKGGAQEDRRYESFAKRGNFLKSEFAFEIHFHDEFAIFHVSAFVGKMLPFQLQ
jgi:hypothetical protein